MPNNHKHDNLPPEWMDLKATQRYASVSERTLREWVHLATDPLPASQVNKKIFIRRSAFDRWMESHRISNLDIGDIVEDIVASVTRPN